MKKPLAFFALISVLLCIVLPACSEPWRVYDNAKLLTQDETIMLEERISQFQKETKMDFVFLSTDDYVSENSFDFGCFFWENGPFGYGKEASGVLYYLDMKHRLPCLITSGNAVSLISDDECTILHEAVHEFLVNGDYCEAVTTIIERTEEMILEEAR